MTLGPRASGWIVSDKLIPVFVSVGRHYRPEEAVLIELLFAQLRALGVDPRTLPRDQWDEDTPLRVIASLMRQCRGALVIAFSRMRYVTGYEWPESPLQITLETRDVATVWLHVEAALAFAFRLPTLVLVERRLHPEGLLNPKHHEYRAIEYDMLDCQDGLPAFLIEALNTFVVELTSEE